MSSAAYSAFDRLALDYDSVWTYAPAGVQQRQAVHLAITPRFRSCRFVLDLGCGTGVDAHYLQSLGIDVYAIDSSSAMVREARRRGVNAQCRDMEDLHHLPFAFDGVLSNFGALNCAASLPTVAGNLSSVLKSGSPVALCLLGRVCLWEAMFYLLRGRWKKAFRRLRGRASSSLGFTVSYPSHQEVLEAFGKRYRLIRWQGIGLFVPPSYVPVSAVMAQRLAFVDRLVARLPVFRACADHRLYLFERL
jgi:SAM-dependent methyltransferase